MQQAIKINPADTVAVALKPLAAGVTVTLADQQVVLQTDIPAGHKIALKDMAVSEPIIKYGFPIGRATAPIAKGSHVHVHNLKTLLSGELEYTYHPTRATTEKLPPETFMGYPRKDGRVGVRNELWIIPTVGCINDVARGIVAEAQHLVGGGVEAVNCLTHPYGCSQLGEDQEDTRKILADFVTHPNAGGVLLLGLGCENSRIDTIQKYMGDYDQSRVRFLVCQDVKDEHQEALRLLEELAEQMRSERRVPCSTEKLIVGMKCGGSDGFSGITANPVIGAFSDLLIAKGGSTIMTEVPEMFGAETILMNRCQDENTFHKTVSLINGFKHYFESNNQPIYENPSPGNKDGGISSLEDKALGCTQKSGTTPVRDVLSYGQKVTCSGLNLLYGPGNDMVSTTAMSASGAQILLFSTGRGTPFAAPVPTLKIGTNLRISEEKPGWIDFSAAGVLEGQSISQLSRSLLDKVLAVANGEKTLSEQKGYHDCAIFKTGITL